MLFRTKLASDIHRSVFFSLLFALTLAITGCGGGGGGGSDPGSSGGTTAESAITLTYPTNLPHSDSMPFSTGRYYKIRGLQPGYQYQFTLTTGDPLWLVEAGSLSCWGDTSCLLTAPASGEILFQVVFSGNDPDGARYTLNAQSVTHEGTLDAPQDLTGLLPYSGTVKKNIYNYYVISGLTPGNSYTFTDDGVSVRIYQDQFAGNGFSNTDLYSNQLPFTAASDTVWVRVDDSWEDATFTLTLTDNGLPDPIFSSEGAPETPIELSLDTLYLGQTDDTASYYHIGGLLPNKEYGIGLDLLSGNSVPLWVYNQSGYGTEACMDAAVTFGENIFKCVVAASDSGDLWIKIDGTTAERLLGSGYSLMVYTYFADEGTSMQDKLLSFSTDIPYNGTVDTLSRYTLTGLEPNVTYITTINGYDSSANLSFNLAKAYNWTAGCYSQETTPGTQSCSLVSHPDDGTLAFEVAESQDYIGTPFTLEVVRSPYQSEGTATSPHLLTIGSADLPYAGEVGAADSYYEIGGVTSGQAYTVTFSGLQDTQDIYVYDDLTKLGSTYSSDYSCADSGASASCTVRATTTSIWVRVGHDDHTPTGFTMNAELSPYQAEGTIGSPLALSFGVSYGGMVDPSQSYYEISGLTPGESYVVTATGISSDGTPVMYLYDDVALLGSTLYGEAKCYVYLSDPEEYCTVTPVGSSVWIMVDGYDYGAGGVFTLNSDISHQAESLTLDYSAGAFPHAGSTDQTTSTYIVTGISPNQYYEVSLTNLSADVDLRVSSVGSSYSTCVAATGTTAETCGFTTSYDGTMKIVVSGNKTLYGGTFTLGVTSGSENQGSSTAPVALDGTVNLPYNGEVSAGSSYYKLQGLAPNTFYAVSLTNLTANADLTLHEISDYSSTACYSNKSGTTAEWCGATSNASGELFVKVESRTSTGSTFTLGAEIAPISEGSIGGEVTLAYGTTDLPYSGSVGVTQSYYAISNLSSNTTYNVTLTNLTGGEVTLQGYINSDFTFANCSDTVQEGVPATCTLTTGNGGSVTVYVKVNGSNSKAGATYTLNIAP